ANTSNASPVLPFPSKRRHLDRSGSPSHREQRSGETPRLSLLLPVFSPHANKKNVISTEAAHRLIANSAVERPPRLSLLLSVSLHTPTKKSSFRPKRLAVSS